MFCPRCGAQNDASDVTCLRCGTELPKPKLATGEEGPRPTRGLPSDISTGDVASEQPTAKIPGEQPRDYQPPLPPPPPTPDFDQLQSNPGYGAPYGAPGYGNPPPGYGAPGSYGSGSAYQNPQGYGNAPSYGAVPPPTGSVNNYLVWSILATSLSLFCCLPLPFGIVAIVYSTQVNSKLGMGDYYGALDASKKAKMWCIITASIGAAFLVLSFFFGVLDAIFSGGR